MVSNGLLTRGRLADHPLWSRALGSEALLGRLVLPVVVSDSVEDRETVEGAGGIERLSITELVREARRASADGLAGLLVFGASDRKDETALIASERDHIVSRAVRAVKDAVPDLGVATDVCVCAYTVHGQCVLFGPQGADVPRTLERLQEIAIVHADAGADLLVPSGMLDGTVAAIRAGLSSERESLPVAAMARLESVAHGAQRAVVGAVPILDRAVPLLAIDSETAVRARVARDLADGADAVVIEPAGFALDIIQALADSTDRPLIALHSATEHAAFVAAVDVVETSLIELEALLASRRAGASLIVSYGARGVSQS